MHERFAGVFVAAVIFLLAQTVSRSYIRITRAKPTVWFSLTVTDLFCVVVEASSLAGLVGRRRRRFAGAGGGDE